MEVDAKNMNFRYFPGFPAMAGKSGTHPKKLCASPHNSKSGVGTPTGSINYKRSTVQWIPIYLRGGQMSQTTLRKRSAAALAEKIRERPWL